MKRPLAVLATIAALALACGEGDAPDESAIPTTNAGLSDPWNGMGLPVGTAEVIVSDPTVALLAYDGGDFAALTGTWEAAWAAGGWTQKDKFTDENFVAGIYGKGSAEVGWAMGADQGVVLAYLEDLNVIPPEASTVQRAKTGERKVTRSTRPSSGGGKASGVMPRGGGTGGGTAGGGAGLPRSGGDATAPATGGGGGGGGNRGGGALPR